MTSYFFGYIKNWTSFNRYRETTDYTNYIWFIDFKIRRVYNRNVIIFVPTHRYEWGRIRLCPLVCLVTDIVPQRPESYNIIQYVIIILIIFYTILLLTQYIFEIYFRFVVLCDLDEYFPIEFLPNLRKTQYCCGWVDEITRPNRRRRCHYCPESVHHKLREPGQCPRGFTPQWVRYIMHII